MIVFWRGCLDWQGRRLIGGAEHRLCGCQLDGREPKYLGCAKWGYCRTYQLIKKFLPQFLFIQGLMPLNKSSALMVCRLDFDLPDRVVLDAERSSASLVLKTVGRKENQKIGFDLLFSSSFEQIAKQRNVTNERNPIV